MNIIITEINRMPNYENSFVYKLVNSVDNKIYIGSTTQALSKRLGEHKNMARRKPNRNVYAHLVSVGWENVRIILIESVTAFNKDQLRAREQHYIDLLKPDLNSANAVKMPCEHGRRKDQCIECKGSATCEHSKRKSQCGLCNVGKYVCPYCETQFCSKSDRKKHFLTQRHIKLYNAMFLECFGELP